MSNIFSDIPTQLSQELTQTLAQGQQLRIERIVSKGHCSEADDWYDQTETEWVVVLQGEAILKFETHEQRLVAGDYVLIPAHTKHRVSWTPADTETIWLAVFFSA